MPPQTEIDIFWWNTNDFYHYDENKKGDRWPKSPGEYTEKCSRIDNALKNFFTHYKEPEIIGLCEITAKSANDLRNRLLKSYSFFSLDLIENSPTLNIAVFYKDCTNVKIEEIQPIVIDRTPSGTRPMAVVDIKKENSTTRLILCHWQPRTEGGDDLYKIRIAEYLTNYIYDYLNPQEGTPTENRNIIILGDLNEEPFDKIPTSLLSAHRHREKATHKSHWSDKHTKKIHLYNCTWRLLGEKQAAKSNSGFHVAGSYYWNSKKSWHTLDQILVSGGLLTDKKPHIDEAHTQIVNLNAFMPSNDLPIKFEYSTKNGYIGLSDHLPIHTKLIY